MKAVLMLSMPGGYCLLNVSPKYCIAFALQSKTFRHMSVPTLYRRGGGGEGSGGGRMRGAFLSGDIAQTSNDASAVGEVALRTTPLRVVFVTSALRFCLANSALPSQNLLSRMATFAVASTLSSF